MAPGQYYLIQLAVGTNLSAPLPTPDAIGSTAMSATGGKVALVTTRTGLACNGGSAPCDAVQQAQIVDLVGWNGANFFETAAAPTTSNTTAVIRGAGGCTDTDSNAADFVPGAPAPRNSASPRAPCLVDLPPSLTTSVPSSGAAGIAVTADISITALSHDRWPLLRNSTVSARAQPFPPAVNGTLLALPERAVTLLAHRVEVECAASYELP